MRSTMMLAAVAALALPLGAQHEHGGTPPGGPPHPEAGPMAQPGMMGMPLMREIHTWRPQHLLERREVLGLSAPQVERLTTLSTAAQQAHDQARAQAQDHFRQASDAWTAGNADAVTQHVTAGMQAMQGAHLAMLQAATSARGVLTAEQRARVQGWMDAQRMGARPRAGMRLPRRRR